MDYRVTPGNDEGAAYAATIPSSVATIPSSSGMTRWSTIKA